jgi:hypothetical protein
MLLEGKSIGGSVEDIDTWPRIQVDLLNALKMPAQA